MVSGQQYLHFIFILCDVAHRYKKMREAKDMTTKTEAEKRAIFGSAMTRKTASSTTAAGTAPSSSTSSEASTTAGGEEDAEKVGHAPVVDVFSAVKAAVQGSSRRGEGGSESGEEGKGAKKAKKEKREKKEKRKEKK
jgi:predicted nucleotidyltransferase